jgi:filamentous hemagglutinin family protein
MARQAPVVWRELLLATTCLVVASPAAYAASPVLPTGPSVVAGSGSISTPSANSMVIRQGTDKAIFNWQAFSISSGASVAFQQPNSGSIALNRVTGPGASQIDGSLTANGHVWLVNPNGVFFGAGSQVNVGGLLATTADIRDQDFLSGNYNFSGATGAAIVNQGEIRAASGGYVVLAGAQVRNEGLIQANLGTVQLAAGKSFALDLTGDKLIRFQVTEAVDMTPIGPDGKPVDSLVTNTGELIADGGRVVMTARAARNVIDNVINTTGIVEATSVSMVNGEIVLDGGENGAVQVAGRLDASGKQSGQTGGSVSVLGDKVVLASAASVDVSGAAGGGTALIGGAAHGAGPQQNASVTLVAGGATITADALSNGDGGTVVLWSEKSTHLAGSITARGGALGGNGGFVETSSKGDLGITSTALIDVAGPVGRGGQWLLDPSNVTIGNGSHGTVAASTISGSLSAGTNVTITTGFFGHDAGNITVNVNGAIAKTAGGNAALTLNAANDITVNAAITSTVNKLDVNLIAGGAVGVNARLATNGGDLTSTSSRFANSAAITLGTGSLKLITDRIALGGGVGAISGTGSATLAPKSDRTTIGLGSADGTFSLIQTELNTLSGFSSLTIGKPDGGRSSNHGSQQVNLGGQLSFALPTTIVAGLHGDIELESSARISAPGSSLTFATGSGGRLTQHYGATLTAANAAVAIDADSISLQGPAGSLSGAKMEIAGARPSTSIGVGTGSGTLRITQSTIDQLANFTTLGIGTSDTGTGRVTIDGSVALRTTTGFGGQGNGASVVLGSHARITTTAPEGSGLGFFSGSGGSVTQNAGARVNAGASTLFIGADHIVLNGSVDSIRGSRGVVLSGGGSDQGNAITVGGAGSLVTQSIIDKLTHFSDLTIGASLPAIPGITPPAGTSLITVSGAITADIATTFAATAPGGKTVLNNGTTLSSSAKAIDFAGAVVLGGNGSSPTLVTIDTTKGGTVPGGAAITFGGTVDGTMARLQSLTLTAGSAGDVTFSQRVGVNDIGGGVQLGNVLVSGARNVNLNVAYGLNGDGFSANSFSIGTTSAAGAASLTAASYIAAKPGAGPGVITINTTGDVSIERNLRANGSVSGAPGGIVTIVSDGDVTIGRTIVQSATSEASIAARGFDATATNQSTGHGGTVTVTAHDITLMDGVSARGGDALVAGPDGSAISGGAGGSIVLNATGEVKIGTLDSGNVAGASARGGASVSGTGGAGGSVSIGASRMLLSTVNVRGGDTKKMVGAGDAGNILLTATATSGHAVTLVGVADPTISNTLSARGGRVGVTGFGSDDGVGGTIAGRGGNITIQGGAGGAALNGTSDIMLATGTASSLNGGALVALTNSGGSAAGAITIAGPVVAAADNGQSLRLSAKSGSVDIGGPVGAIGQRVSALTLTGDSSTMTFQGPITLGSALLDQRGTGSVTFDGLLSVPNLIMSPGTVTLALNGGTNITGSATLSGTVTAPGLALNVPVTLAGDTTIDTSASNGPLALGAVVGAHGLTLAAGGGAVTLGTIGGETALTSLSVSGTMAIDGSGVTTSGGQTYTGAMTLGTDTVLTSTGNGAIAFTSTVDGAHALTVNTAGQTIFGGSVGSIARLASLSTDAPGSTAINGAVVSTTGGQAFNDAVILGFGGTVVASSTGGSDIRFGSTVDSAVAGTSGLTVNTAGATIFGGMVGGGTALGSLTTDAGGTTSLGGGVTTSGGAIKLGAVRLSVDSILSTSGGTVTAGTIDGAHNLTINSGADAVAINGTIGGTTKVNGLALNGSGTATIASVTALGSLDLSGKTAGSVTFTGAVNIDALTTAANPYSIAFNGGGSIGDPIFSNTGTLTFNGGMSVSGGLLADGPSATTLNGILASDNNPIAIQHLVIGGDSAIVTGTGAVILGSVDQGAHRLVIAGGGNGLNADLFFGLWTGTGVRLIEPATVGASVGLAGAAGDFTLDANSLHILASGGPSLVKIGRDDLSGAMAANALTFDAPLMLFGSSISLNGALTKNSGDLTLRTANGISGQLALARTVTLALNSGGNVQLQNSNGLQLGNMTASGTLSLTADGAITQLGGTTIVAAGTMLATSSGNDITLTNAGNNFDAGNGTATLAVTGGGNVQIIDSNVLQLGNVTAAGTLSVNANGGINQAAGTALLAAGTTLVALNSGNITLNNAGNDFDRGGGAATLTATGGNLSLTDTNSLQLGNILSSGTLSLTAGGNITQTPGTGIFARGTTLAAGGDIVLTNAGNDFDIGGGAATLTITRGANAQLTDANALTGTLNLSGELAVSATSAVFVASIAGGQSGAAAANHASTYAPVGAGPYTINDVTFPVPSAPPAAPVVVPPTVQPTPPTSPPLPVADIIPPPPPPSVVDTVLGGQAEAGAALANIAPAAGPSSGETDTGSSTPTDGDKLAQSLSKPLSNTPAPQPTGKKPSTTSVVIGGMLSKFQPPSGATPPSGTTPSGQNFSSWGNEAFW